MFKLISNKKEFEEFYPYKGYKPKKYPKKYPCLIKNEVEDGGIMGEGYVQEIIYFPKNVDIDSFIKGVNIEAENYIIYSILDEPENIDEKILKSMTALSQEIK